MYDWNGDGKNDWHDDALFHTVINKTDPEEHMHTSKSGSGRSGCMSWIIGVIVFLWIISKLAG